MPSQLRKQDWETSTYLLLAVVNLAIGCYLIYSSPVGVVTGDAEQYYEIAKALVGKGGHLYYWRGSWGYPFLLILTGYPWSRWPVITQLVQVCMASAIPYFVGSSLRYAGAKSWICIAAAVAAFLTMPTVFALGLQTETFAEFLIYLAIWVVARAMARTEGAATGADYTTPIKWQIAAAVGAAFFALYMVRPANGLLSVIGLIVGFATAGYAVRGLMLRSLGILIVLTLIWMPVQKVWTAWVETRTKQSFETDAGFAGASFFLNVYTAGPTFVGRSTIRPENGQCSALVYEAVEKNIGTIGDRVRQTANRPPATTQEIFAVHDGINFVVIWQSVEHDFGAKEQNRILWCAAFEAIRAEPKSLLYFYDGLVAFFLFDDLVYYEGYREAWRSLDKYVTQNFLLWGWSMFGGAAIKVIAFLVALVTAIPTWQRGGRPWTLAAMLWAMLLYLAAVHVVFASETWRFTEPLIPGLVLLAALGCNAMATLERPKLIPRQA
jgi:hypothetical protein